MAASERFSEVKACPCGAPKVTLHWRDIGYNKSRLVLDRARGPVVLVRPRGLLDQGEPDVLCQHCGKVLHKRSLLW